MEQEDDDETPYHEKIFLGSFCWWSKPDFDFDGYEEYLNQASHGFRTGRPHINEVFANLIKNAPLSDEQLAEAESSHNAVLASLASIYSVGAGLVSGFTKSKEPIDDSPDVGGGASPEVLEGPVAEKKKLEPIITYVRFSSGRSEYSRLEQLYDFTHHGANFGGIEKVWDMTTQVV